MYSLLSYNALSLVEKFLWASYETGTKVAPYTQQHLLSVAVSFMHECVAMVFLSEAMRFSFILHEHV